jgi:hypothetical protein
MRSPRLLSPSNMFEHQPSGPQHGHGVGDPLPAMSGAADTTQLLSLLDTIRNDAPRSEFVVAVSL